MNEKVWKITVKSLVLLPIGLSLWVLINGFDLEYWVIPVIAGLVISFGIVFWNIFDYEKFEDIDMSDFLESTHRVTFKYNSKNWNNILQMIQTPFVKLEILEKIGNIIKTQVHQKFIDSILTIEKSENEIIVDIEKKQ
ncbi:hypothetical protein [Arenibacter certesii]|uniref:Uncharacterized protein n=1 Tax=Arenibacter certesii TaxID=228955 RepID=A0A918IR05_9FLAO|nr:hypothetical protein [Arenibacter certesii]GGW26241.1 hypothetical protein GCM10007383_09090 [Arenibacter certesii]